MDIQHHDKPEKLQEIRSLQELYESDGDLVQQLVYVINSLFSPLPWILEEILYRRIKKKEKGWIDIDYLNRNPKVIELFKENGIPSQTRRKRNILQRAIRKSILKKKKNLIKRKVYLNMNKEIKKVIYFESKEIKNINRVEKMQVESQNQYSSFALTQTNLSQIIKKAVRWLIYNRKRSTTIHEQQIQMRQSQELNLNEIEFYGSFKQDSKFRKIHENDAHQNSSQEYHLQKTQQYRWCFVYLPHIPFQIAEQLSDKLKQIFAGQHSKQKMSFNNQLSKYIVTQEAQIAEIHIQAYDSFEIYSLKEMVEKFCPKYDEICQTIGYKKKDQHQEWLKVKSKQKQKQKIRLLESVDLDKKIDVRNYYHVKLQIQKLRKGYLKEKQAEYQRKMRQREQKKSNKAQFKMQEAELKRDTLTEKLKSLLGLKNQQTRKQMLGTSQNLQNEDEKNNKDEKDDDKNLQQIIQQDALKIHIKLSKYVENQDQNIYVDQINGENEIYESFFEEQDGYESIQSFCEEYQIPQKKYPKKINSKEKKIAKSHGKSVNEVKNCHKTAVIQRQIEKPKRQNEDTEKNSKQISNTTYNLRHKTPMQGSYLKMIETIGEEGSSVLTQKTKNDKYSRKFQNIIDECHQISNSRSLRSKRRQNDQQI